VVELGAMLADSGVELDLAVELFFARELRLKSRQHFALGHGSSVAGDEVGERLAGAPSMPSCGGCGEAPSTWRTTTYWRQSQSPRT
jgi:hypothetical protein